MSEISVLITGSTGAVGTYAAYFMARQGLANKLYLCSRDVQRVSTVVHNARVIAIMEEHDLDVRGLECDLLNPEMASEQLNQIKPTLIINSATLLSLYPFFPSLKKRQKRMNFVAGFAHTLPKDLAILWPFMKAVKEASPETLVVNLAAPDLGNAILKKINLSPTIGAGTIDSTVQGIRLAVSRREAIPPSQLDIRMVAHHAIRRFPPGEVPFILRIYRSGEDITGSFNLEELIEEAADVSGVETMTTPVTNNAAITAASAVATARALLADREIIRHAAGVNGQVGGTPVRLGLKRAQVVLPEDIEPHEAARVNEAGMRMTGVDHIDEVGTVTFTERERFWLREGMGLDWEKMKLEDALPMSKALKEAYIRLQKEESP